MMASLANSRECFGERTVTVQTLPWVLISPTIAPDGKHLLAPPLNQSLFVCITNQVCHKGLVERSGG